MVAVAAMVGLGLSRCDRLVQGGCHLVVAVFEGGHEAAGGLEVGADHAADHVHGAARVAEGLDQLVEDGLLRGRLLGPHRLDLGVMASNSSSSAFIWPSILSLSIDAAGGQQHIELSVRRGDTSRYLLHGRRRAYHLTTCFSSRIHCSG